MSATRTHPVESTRTADRDAEAEAEPKEARLERYLRERAREGELYFKSKFIADDVDLSPKEIGALIVKLQASASDLTIEKWSYTGATTWRVEAV